MAQQPTATISALSGTVLVNEQEQGTGTVLGAGDIIETQAGAKVVLELSDKSLLELGENTKLDIIVLSQTATGARISRVKLLWGRVRTALSPDHQQAGSTFDIDTPNAAIGVKFSQPDVEVSYDSAKQETVGIAHTVELVAKNLLTDEEKVVPVGSTVIIVGLLMKITAGTAAMGTVGEIGATETMTTGAEAATGTTTKTGVRKGKMIAIGIGALATMGGIGALVRSSGESEPEPTPTPMPTPTPISTPTPTPVPLPAQPCKGVPWGVELNTPCSTHSECCSGLVCTWISWEANSYCCIPTGGACRYNPPSHSHQCCNSGFPGYCPSSGICP